MKTLRTLVALALLAGLSTACDSESGGTGASPFTCTDGVSDFEPCGGNPSGDWDFDSACFDYAEAWAGNDMMAACPEAKVSGVMDWQGSASFRDGQATLHMTGGSSATHLEIPVSCLKGVACDGVVPEYACVAKGDTCVCDQSSPLPAQPDDAMPYRVEGTDLVVGEGADANRTALCVRGDWAAVRLSMGPDTGNPDDQKPLILTLRRK